jgi:signal recognition particle subunit SRP54
MDALDVFYPERMASRILGMGDVISLVERAQEQFDEEQAKRLEKRIKKDQFDFNDFLDQIGQIKKMGSVKDLLGMVPGMSKLKDEDINEDAFKHIEAIIYSMTPKERANPTLLNGHRKSRIADGSGTSVQEVNKLLKQFEDTRKMMKMMGNKENMAKMMQQMKNMPGMGR